MSYYIQSPRVARSNSDDATRLHPALEKFLKVAPPLIQSAHALTAMAGGLTGLGDCTGPEPDHSLYRTAAAQAAGMDDWTWQNADNIWWNCQNAKANPATACPNGYHYESPSVNTHGGGCVDNLRPGDPPKSQPSASYAAGAIAYDIPASLIAPGMASPNYASGTPSTSTAVATTATPVTTTPVLPPTTTTSTSSAPSSSSDFFSASIFGIPVWLLAAGGAGFLFLRSKA